VKENKQEEYNRLAIEWAKKFTVNNQPLIDIKSFDGITIHDSHYTLGIWINRLKYSKSREKSASYYKIKKFKDWLLKENQNETI
jgi:hypothetical protein